MKACLSCGLVAGVFMLTSATSQGQVQIEVSDERVPAFSALEQNTLIQFEALPLVEATDVEPQLINGIPVNPEFFPAVFRMTTGGTCTATVVGPAAVLLAAHCVDHLARISFITGEVSIAGICEQAPGFVSIDESEDWTMCLLEREISGFPYESVDLEVMPGVGDRLVLMGYGCTQRGGPLDGLLRIGVSQVVDKPTTWLRETSTLYTASDLSAGDAVLCPGDSGGPLYRFTGGFDDARQVVGVNSRTTFEFGISLFSATASPAGAAFLRGWVERHGQQVCGINMMEGCR